MNANAPTPDDADTRLVLRIVQALKDLRYGSLEIVVHDGHIVQFERRERVRLDRHDGNTRR